MMIFGLAVGNPKMEDCCDLVKSMQDENIGTFVPKCDDDCTFVPKQCLASSGYCWCTEKNGTKRGVAFKATTGLTCENKVAV